jgi:hypothetical protein
VEERTIIVPGPTPIRIVDAEGTPRDQLGGVVHRCHNCGADLPRDLGDWIIDAGAGGRVALYCSQQCATQAIEELEQ